MKPFYADEFATLYNADVRELLPCLDIVADAAIADPPYAETSLQWDRWPDRWVSTIGDSIKPAGSLWCFGSMRMFLDRRDDFTFWRFVQEIVWEKHNGSGFLTDRFRRVHEFAVHYVRVGVKWEEVYKSPQFTMDATKRTVRKKEKPAQWHGKTGSTTFISEDGGPRLMRSVIHCRSEHGRAQNETQKPLGILRPLIEYSCPPGGLLLVPFAGAGSEMVAAKELGRKSIGFELRAEQCEAAATRLRQGVLFPEAKSA